MRDKRRNDEAGMALVLALLSLMLLTFLGLALAATTSTELQIANNYRWSQQAFYNAEAGLEIAKNALGSANWETTLPTLRVDKWYGTSTLDSALAAPGTIAAGSRDYENWACDWRGHGMGYGKVLNDGATTYANVTTIRGQALRGAFTIWVRRPLAQDTTTGYYSDATTTPPDVVITAEGVAPYTDAMVGTALASQNQAVRTLEAQVGGTPMAKECTATVGGGQTGLNAEGSNFAACYAIDKSTMKAALGITSGGSMPADDSVR
jgi:hypothetical protein